MRASLGKVAHAMHEKAWKGGFADVDESNLRAAASDTWSALCATEYETILDQASGVDLPPKPAEWPGYEVTRARTIRRVTEISTTPRTGRSSDGQQIHTELQLVDPEIGLEGRLDRLQVVDGRFHVTDLKSGIWQGDVASDQEQQLLLYAALVRTVFGQLPSSISIETAEGRTYSLPVHRDDVDVAVATAVRLVDQFNTAASGGWPALEALSRPNDEGCRHCPARILCEPYWRALQSGWRFHGAARGTVADLTAVSGCWTVKINTSSPCDRTGRMTSIYRLPIEAREPASIAVVGAEQRSDPGTVRIIWDSQFILG